MLGNTETVWVKKWKEAWNKTHEPWREDRKAWKERLGSGQNRASE